MGIFHKIGILLVIATVLVVHTTCHPAPIPAPAPAGMWETINANRRPPGEGGVLEPFTRFFQPLVWLFTNSDNEGSILAPITNLFGIRENRGGFLSLIGIKDGKDGTPFGILEYNRLKDPNGGSVYFKPLDIIEIQQKKPNSVYVDGQMQAQ